MSRGGDDARERLVRFLSEEEPPPTPGQQKGRYRLERELGRGGMAVVFAATDLDLNREVAVKVLTTATSQRTRDEARAAARLHHPNVVTVYEVGPDFIAMELVRGQTLSDVWSTRAPQQRGQNLKDVLTVARAVAYAHAQGVVHRDLKPQNVLVESETGRLVLTDFGLAETRDGRARARVGRIAGTVPYMAPEEVRGDSAAFGPATDVWALGVMLFQAVVGDVPFKADTRERLFELIASPAVPLPTVPDASPAKAVIARALCKDPLGRHADAGAFAQDLERALSADTARRRRPLRVLLGALAATAVLLPVGLVYNNHRNRAAVLETLRNQARVSLEAALELQRAGANSRMRQFLPPLQAAYEDARARAPDLAEVEYLMGRMHRALLDNGQALQRQNDALKKDPHFLPALYERAVLLTLAHGRARALDDGGPDDVRPPLPSEDAGEAIAAWQRFQQARAGGTGAAHTLLTPIAGEVAVAMLAHLEGRYAVARQGLDAVLARDPLLDEAWEILARAARADQTAATAALDRLLKEREAKLDARLVRNRGYAPDYVSRAMVRLRRADRQRARGEDPTALFRGAFSDLSVALESLPDAEAWELRGRVQLYEARWLFESGGDPTALCVAAEKDLTHALALDPGRTTALGERGDTHRVHASFLEGAGRDGRAHFAAAARDWEAASQRAPERLSWRQELAKARGRWAYAEGRRGGEAAALFAAAERDFAFLVAHDWKPTPHDLASWGELALDEARVLVARGEDPRGALDRALDRTGRAAATGRTEFLVWQQRGLALLEHARHLERGGQQAAARQQYGLAATALSQATTLRPTLGASLAEPLAQARQRSRTLP